MVSKQGGKVRFFPHHSSYLPPGPDRARVFPLSWIRHPRAEIRAWFQMGPNYCQRSCSNQRNICHRVKGGLQEPKGVDQGGCCIHGLLSSRFESSIGAFFTSLPPLLKARRPRDGSSPPPNPALPKPSWDGFPCVQVFFALTSAHWGG